MKPKFDNIQTIALSVQESEARRLYQKLKQFPRIYQRVELYGPEEAEELLSAQNKGRGFWKVIGGS